MREHRHLHVVRDDESAADLPIPDEDGKEWRYRGVPVPWTLYTLLMQRESAREYMTEEMNRVREVIRELSEKISDTAQEENVNLDTIFPEGPW
jgi:hypothetical protein